MNLIEAVKSGRPFRRVAWLKTDYRNPDSWSQSFLKQDILADDWEIQEPTVTITRSQFWEAVNAEWTERSMANDHCVRAIARALGLGDP